MKAVETTELRELLLFTLSQLRLFEKKGLLSLDNFMNILNDLLPSKLCMYYFIYFINL